MKNKLFFTGLIFVAVLFGLVFWKSKDNVRENELLFGNDLKSFCFNKTCLIKNDEIWFSDDDNFKIPANQELAQNYLDKFKQIRFKEVVSENPERFSGFGIGNTTCVLEASGLKIDIGNVNYNLMGTYAKLSSENSVRLLNTILEKSSLCQTEYWSKKNLTNIPLQEIQKITIKRSGKDLVIMMANSKWKEEGAVQKLSNLSNLAFLDKFKPEGKDTAEINVETTTKNYLIKLGKNTDNANTIYFVGDSDDFYYQIKKEDYNLLARLWK